MNNPQSRAQKWDIGVLHGFRAIMVLLVANFHIWQQGWLWQTFHVFGLTLHLDFLTRSSYIFVDGMLLLSGFLLFLPHARAMEEGTPLPDTGAFYVNRVARIVPSYVISVLLMLFCFVLPQGSYHSAGALHLDLWTHLTFCFTFFRMPYQHTPLNGVLWTVVIEMQMYLIFPLLAKGVRRKPVLTLSLMALAGWIYRALVYFLVPDTSMFINQMPAFLDVYAIGMLGAIAYCKLRKRMGDPEEAQPATLRIAGLLAFVAGILLVLAITREQSRVGVQGYEQLRHGQLAHRLPLALSLMIAMLGATCMPGVFRWLLSNRLMRFLSLISYNFYIWHQVLSVQMARYWFPDTLHSDRNLQWAFTTLCFAVSLVVAMAFTYGWEQPCAKWIRKGAQRLMKSSS